MMRALVFLVILTGLSAGCKKDPVEYSATPEISVVSVSPTTVQAWNDSITFVISYTDGDGDLGENSPTAKNLFLTDSRIGTPYQYRISELAPDAAIAIRGTLTLVLASAGILGSTPETATYSIYVKDRAGQSSNVVVSPVITVNP